MKILDEFPSDLSSNLKASNIYTDSEIQLVSQKMLSMTSTLEHKIHKLEQYIDQQVDKINKTKIERNDIDQIELNIISRIEIEYLNDLLKFKDLSIQEINEIKLLLNDINKKQQVIEDITADIQNFSNAINE